jgi:hypothetical protein
VARRASSIWASEANQHAIEDAGLSFILGTRIPEEPYVVKQWRREHPDHDIDDGQVSTQSWPATQAQKAKGRRLGDLPVDLAQGRAAPSRARSRSSGTGSSRSPVARSP